MGVFDYNILSTEFLEIIKKRNKIKEMYKTLETKLATMKSRYTSLIQNNNKKIFIYCLDSFFFQYKILLLELEHYDKVNKTVLNRMYGDYYKLYMGILESCKNNAFDIDGSMKTTPSYKDIDTSIEYKTEDLATLHSNILVILKQLSTHYDNKKGSLQSHDEACNIGFSITSFLDTLGYENRLLYEQINLYNSYLQFYHSSQNGYLDKILENMEKFDSDIDREILVNHKNVKTESISKFNLIKQKFNNGTLLDSLKNSKTVEKKVVDEIKVDEIKVDEIKVDEIKVDEIKVDEIKVDEIKVDEIKVDEIKVDEIKVDEIKVDEIKVDEIKVDEIKVDEIKVDEIKVDEIKVDVGVDVNQISDNNDDIIQQGT